MALSQREQTPGNAIPKQTPSPVSSSSTTVVCPPKELTSLVVGRLYSTAGAPRRVDELCVYKPPPLPIPPNQSVCYPLQPTTRIMADGNPLNYYLVYCPILMIVSSIRALHHRIMPKSHKKALQIDGTRKVLRAS